MKPGDIILVRGRGALSEGILRATNGSVSHAALLIGTGPEICIEALERVKTNPLIVTLGNCEHAYVMTNPSLTDEQRGAIVYAALTFSGEDYNYLDLGLQALDALSHSNFFTHHLAHSFLDRWPICSYLASKAYERAINWQWGKPSDSITPQDLFLAGQAPPWELRQLS
jgi:hypothetical protein